MLFTMRTTSSKPLKPALLVGTETRSIGEAGRER